MITATYSPEDNKIRLYPSERLDEETYKRVKAAGFKWAPKQELFVAPMWTPEREDLAIELAGEIEDETMSMAERAEIKAERLKGYAQKRATEAERCAENAKAIGGRFEFGQPILVGHHSEKKARKDAEKIEQNMLKAARLFDTADYWAYRARGAMAHASYKANPVAVARRIKSIESDRRKAQKTVDEAKKAIAFWESKPKKEDALIWLGTLGRGFYIYDDSPTGSTHAYHLLKEGKVALEKVYEHGIRLSKRTIERLSRWLSHYDNRLTYEREFIKSLSDTKPVSTGVEMQVGGTVWRKIDGMLVPRIIVKVNKGAEGRAVSVKVNDAFGFYGTTLKVEKIEKYYPPTEDMEKAAKASAKNPIVNYSGDGIVEMTKEEYKAMSKYRRCVRTAVDNDFGMYRVRLTLGNDHKLHQVFLTNSKVIERPAKTESLKCTDSPEPIQTVNRIVDNSQPDFYEKAKQAKEHAKLGVQVVTANQLFPTPQSLAERMVSEAGLNYGETVLEPSAGTGRILKAIYNDSHFSGIEKVVAVEINGKLCDSLKLSYPEVQLHRMDFLKYKPNNLFNKIIMNPPFENGVDIKHIMHAWSMLASGGRLVAICAFGPRQKKEIGKLVDDFGGVWENLPDGSFKESGTNVHTALIIVDKPL